MFRRLKPVRDDLVKDNMVADLDALISDPVFFQSQGKTFKINPITTEEFLKVTSAFSKIDTLKDKKEITHDELIYHYYRVIKSVCPDIKVKHLNEMTQAQLGALFNLVIDVVQGKHFPSEKKKSLTQDKKI